jgi:hypothetical protein
MLTDKDLALQLIDQIEDLYLEISVLEAVLELKGVAPEDLKQIYKHVKAQAKYRNSVHANLQPLRDAVLDAPDLTAAVRHMLEGLERIDPEGTKGK